MQPTSTGSFGAAAGGVTPELQAAMQSRSQGGATSQVTQGAATFDPSTQPAQSPTGQPPMPQSGAAIPASPSQGTGLPFDSSESKLIISALSGRLKSLSKVQEMSGGG